MYETPVTFVVTLSLIVSPKHGDSAVAVAFTVLPMSWTVA